MYVDVRHSARLLRRNTPRRDRCVGQASDPAAGWLLTLLLLALLLCTPLLSLYEIFTTSGFVFCAEAPCVQDCKHPPVGRQLPVAGGVMCTKKGS